MKFIEPNVEYIEQQSGLDGIYKQIELAARTCYKSEDKITTDSSLKFVQKLITNGHLAMLEHGAVYLKVEDLDALGINYKVNKYSVVHKCDGFYYISTNLRVLADDYVVNDLDYLVEPETPMHEKRYSFRITTDRGVSHELVRHRAFSFAQESTRYCCYAKDKFDGLTFVYPYWYNKDKADLKEIIFKFNLQDAERTYLNMIKFGAAPQEARAVLPNALKTEIIMTGYANDWLGFLELRLKGKYGKPHPDMAVIAKMIYKQLKELGVLTEKNYL